MNPYASRILIGVSILVFGFELLRAEPRINRIEPLHLAVGKTTRVKVIGNQLQEGAWKTRIWTNFASKWELDETAKNTNGELFFDVTVTGNAKPGPATVRIWNERGVSLPSLLLVHADPPTVSFQTKPDEPFSHTFRALRGKEIICQVWSNRLNRDSDLVLSVFNSSDDLVGKIDDDEVHGSDPVLVFTPKETEDYTAKINDIQWRGGIQGCLQIHPNPGEDFKSRSTPGSPLSLDLKKGQFLTVTPRTIELGSPAQLVLDLCSPEGNRIARAGTGDFLLQPLRQRIDRDGEYQLVVKDLLGRKGLPYEVDISTDEAPFELTVEPRDFYLAKAGKTVKLKFRVARHRFDGPITIACSDFELENAIIPERKGDIEATVMIPEDSRQFVPTTFFGTAEQDGKTYRTAVSTRLPLKKTPFNMLTWPDGVDGTVFFLVQKKGGGDS